MNSSPATGGRVATPTAVAQEVRMICPNCYVKFPTVLKSCPYCDVELRDLSAVVEPTMSQGTLRLVRKHEGLD